VGKKVAPKLEVIPAAPEKKRPAAPRTKDRGVAKGANNNLTKAAPPLVVIPPPGKIRSLPPRTKTRGLETRTNDDLTVEMEAYCRCRAMGMSQEESLKTSEIRRTLNTVRKWESANPKVKARIAELSQVATDKAIERTGLTREYVIGNLQTIVERCMQAEPVYMYENGKRVETGEYKFDSHGANTALKMLGDTLGMFKGKPKEPGEDLAELSDDEVTRIASELAAQTGLAAHLTGGKAPAG
jgi:phage terminase small subunit